MNPPSTSPALRPDGEPRPVPASAPIEVKALEPAEDRTAAAAESASKTASEVPGWLAEDANGTYGFPYWGEGYFGVGPGGRLHVYPKGDAPEESADSERPEAASIDVYDVITGLDDRGVTTPVVVRFPDMVGSRIASIAGAFREAMDEMDYGADQPERPRYRPIFPIKVNQQRLVCEEIRDFGAQHGVGLEAGSKPELLAVLALSAGHEDLPIVCNGFKDAEYIETVVLAQKLGRNILLTVERFPEIELAVKLAADHGVRPRLGVRMKPAAKGSGAWESSTGERSKFGLSADELVAATEYLAERGLGDCLELVHFHVGSQVCDIRAFKTALSELAHTYVELRRLGAGVRVVNVGGGLAVDYDGSASPTLSSKNYSMKDYAEDIVWRLKDVCERAGEPAPTIYSESGRAMTAFSSLLVTDVVGSRRFASDPDLPTIRRHLAAQASGNQAPGDRASGKKADTPASIDELVDAFERVTVLGQAAGAALTDPDDLLNEVTGILHDASQARDEAVKLYQLGYLSLTMRAAAERLYWAVGRRVLAQAELACATSGEPLPTELAGLPPQLADILFCNFSVFQSLPDHWAIRQIFPVAPIHRLDEKPTRRATLADMSCDSDGRVDRFPSLGNEPYHATLPVHEGREGEVYYLGVFLVGAYQEVLGDLHNLFGDTHVVHVSLDDEGRWRIDELIEGDTVRNVLEYVQHNPAEMKRVLRRDTEAAMRAGRLTTGEGRQLLSFCESGLDGYTYLEE